MRTIDVTPFYRTSVGFDRLFNMLDSVTNEAAAQSYPPYNIEKTGEDTYRITLAVSGFADNELDVETKEQSLVISGEKADKEGDHTYLHRGIAARSFQRRFELADNVFVTGAQLENGLLSVDLERRIPEELKPRKIAINGKTGAKVIEGGRAA